MSAEQVTHAANRRLSHVTTPASHINTKVRDAWVILRSVQQCCKQALHCLRPAQHLLDLNQVGEVGGGGQCDHWSCCRCQCQSIATHTQATHTAGHLKPNSLAVSVCLDGVVTARPVCRQCTKCVHGLCARCTSCM